MSNLDQQSIPDPNWISRRWFLAQCGVGLGSMALGQLLGEPGLAAARPGQRDPLAPKAPHYAPKAKNVIFLFMAGAPSHLELLDYKPQLAKFDGTLPPAELLKGYRAAFINPHSKLLGPKFKYSRKGRCNAEVSELLPHLANVVDEIAIVKSMTTDAFNHAPGQILMNTGSQQFGRPSLGAWITYGLGSESQDLPSFVVFSSGSKGPSGGNACWGSGFLPTVHQGVLFRSAGEPVLYLSNPRRIDSGLQKASLDTVRDLNRMRLQKIGDPEIATRINSFEMAFRMQTSVPELMDISREPQSILDLYGAEPGKSSFANNCLLARRLVERGVRFVQLFHESWDQHANLSKSIQKKLPGYRSTLGCSDSRSQATGIAGRNSGHLGRRVRSHTHGSGNRNRRQGPPSQRLCHVVGRRRHPAGHHFGRNGRSGV